VSGVFVVSITTMVLGDPFWNLYLVAFGLFVAAPVGVVAAMLLFWSRRRLLAGP
jgi:hypothetical protein